MIKLYANEDHYLSEPENQQQQDMHAISNQLTAAIAASGPDGFFAKKNAFANGLAQFVIDQAKFLEQPAGVPAQQIAGGLSKVPGAIYAYLTASPDANHQALLAAAQKAVAEFQRNPGYYAGYNAINIVTALTGVGESMTAGRAAMAAERAAVAEEAETLTAVAEESSQIEAAEEGVQIGSLGDENHPPIAEQTPDNPLGVHGPNSYMAANPFSGGKNCVPLSVSGVLRRMDGGIIKADDLILDYPNGTSRLFSDELTNWQDTQLLLKKYFGSRRSPFRLTRAEESLREDGVPLVATGQGIFNNMERAPVGASGVIFAKDEIVENGVKKTISHAYGVTKTDAGIEFWDDQSGYSHLVTPGENPFAATGVVGGGFADLLNHAFAFYPG